MIIVYASSNHFIPKTITTNDSSALPSANWIDLLNPTKEEEQFIESFLRIDIPTKEEMQEIEPSNRLYKENDVLFMTATMTAKSESSEPQNEAVTFILIDDKLVTIRYIEPHAFSLFISRLPKLTADNHHAINLMIELLESTIDRLADIFERVGRNLDQFSQTIFHIQASDKKLNYKDFLQKIGVNGDLNTKAWESLASFNRLCSYFSNVMSVKLSDELQSRLNIVSRDIVALHDHVHFLSTKVNFLLDATLGMVNIDQNNIIKIFSIAAVIFLPPTLIASIYGMNFVTMPELKWHLGYPIAIGLMLISAWLPYQFFKLKKWL